MRKTILTAIVAGSLSFMYAPKVPAQGEMGHHGMQMDESMARQHRLMATYARAQAKINESLQKRDAMTVEAETKKLLATIPDLKKTRPHKNLKKRKEMGLIAAGFEKDLKTTLARVKERDFVRAGKAFKMAEEKCLACHAKFRD